MNSDYITTSSNYAQNAAQTYEESLSYLLNGLDEIKTLDTEAANVRYQNLLTTIKQQLPEIQQEFYTGTKAAYINKQQTEQELNADLSRLGVNTQGFGITQRNQNEIAYGQSYNQLVIDKNKAVREVANEEINALGTLNEDKANINLSYAENKLDTTKYIKEKSKEVYDTEYNKAYQDLQYKDTLEQQKIENEQQTWENAFKEKQYSDTLAQQKFENDLAIKEYNLAVANSKKTYSSGGNNTQPKNKTDDTIVKTTYCIQLPSKSKTATAEYTAFIEATIKSGITVNNLKSYLTEMQNKKIFSAADVAAIKKQFGI